MSVVTESPLLTIPELAQALGVSSRTVHRAIQRNGIKSVHLYDGGQRRIPRSELDRLLGCDGGTAEVLTGISETRSAS